MPKSITIAVLPFVNYSSDADSEYFSDGITEEIINALAKIETLKVTSRTSSFYFKNKELPIAEIASKLDVSNILEGSVKIHGKKVRIKSQLINAEEDYQFWSESWDRELEDIFEIQDEISLLIAEKLREELGHFVIKDHLVDKQTQDIDAYSYALKAKYYFNKWNPTDVKLSIELFEKALEIDDKHVESYVGLADAYGFLATTEFMPREEGWIKAVENTHKAYELDPKNAGVHYQLANLAFFTDFNYASAFEHTVKSLEYKPNYPEAQQFMTFLYMLDGQYEKANRHLQLAIAIDPLSQETKFYQAYFYYRTGYYNKALELFDEMIETNPMNIPAIVTRIYTLFLMNEYDKIEKYLDDIPKEILIPDEKLGMRCLLHIRSGNKSENKYLPELIKAAENQSSFQADSYLFLSYANMKQYDTAFDCFEKAIKMKSSVLLLSFSDPLSGDIRKEKRFKQYQAKIYARNENKEVESKKKSQLLDDDTADKIINLLEKHFEDEKPYLNPTLTLKDLASQIDIHPNQLSWLINEKLGNKFNAYINSYRVEYFKELAQNPANSNISIIGLAYESGFNSKTVFNTFFKKSTGITPFEYIKQLQEK